MLFPLALGLSGSGVLLWLGLWQLDRLEEKTLLLSRIESRMSEPPSPVPRAAGEDLAFLRVEASGEFLREHIYVYMAHKELGPGYRLVSVFSAGGRRLLADRGFVRSPDEARAGPAEISGNLYWPREADWLTPEPDWDKGIWYARDLPRMARALGAEELLVVVSRSAGPGRAGIPIPVSSEGIPNNHLGYAVTWFLLCALWICMSALLAARVRKEALGASS